MTGDTLIPTFCCLYFISFHVFLTLFFIKKRSHNKTVISPHQRILDGDITGRY